MRRLGHMTRPNRQGHIGGGPYRIGAHDFRADTWKQGNFGFAGISGCATGANGLVWSSGGAWGINYTRPSQYWGKNQIVKLAWRLFSQDQGSQAFSFRDQGGAQNGGGSVVAFNVADVDCVVRDQAGGVWTNRSVSPTVTPTNGQLYYEQIFMLNAITAIWSSAAATPINKTRLQVSCPTWAAYVPSAANTPIIAIEGVSPLNIGDRILDYMEVFVW